MFNYILYRVGRFVALRFPLKIGYAIAIFLARIHCFLSLSDRRAVEENLQAIFPGYSRKTIRRLSVGTFENFAKYLVDFFRFMILDKEYVSRNVKVENIHYLDEAISYNRGVIVLSAHLGNWELGGVVIALLSYPLWVVARPHKEVRVDRFFNRQRESKGVRVIPLGHAARLCFNILKGKGLVALVGDIDFYKKGISVDFFGKHALLPQGPAVFALKTGAFIVPGFMLRNPDDTFTLSFEKPIEPVSTGDREQDTVMLASNYKGAMEKYIRRYPEQWYMFRRFWQE